VLGSTSCNNPSPASKPLRERVQMTGTYDCPPPQPTYTTPACLFNVLQGFCGCMHVSVCVWCCAVSMRSTSGGGWVWLLPCRALTTTTKGHTAVIHCWHW
jgi:hypothetical protein